MAMNNMKLKMVLAAVLLTGGVLFAQPPGGGGGGQGQGQPPGASAPIDKGAAGLLFAVVGYSYYSLKRKKELPEKNETPKTIS